MNNSLTILIAEDDADDRFLLKTAFDESGFTDNLHFVENGVELIRHLKLLKEDLTNTIAVPNFILADLNMPKKDGREALKEIKEDEFLRKIPVVVFSTTGNENEKRRCFELGAHSYYTKPVSFRGLLDMVSELHHYWLDQTMEQQ
jgi:CheY-like chemotaxis protein